MDKQLKPCPFCGSEVKIVWCPTTNGCIPMIVCNECGMLLSNKHNKRDTMKFLREAWNRRVNNE